MNSEAVRQRASTPPHTHSNSRVSSSILERYLNTSFSSSCTRKEIYTKLGIEEGKGQGWKPGCSQTALQQHAPCNASSPLVGGAAQRWCAPHAQRAHGGDGCFPARAVHFLDGWDQTVPYMLFASLSACARFKSYLTLQQKQRSALLGKLFG